MAPSPELRAEARVVHPGRTLAVVEPIYNHEGRIVVQRLKAFFRDTKTRRVEVDSRDPAGF